MKCIICAPILLACLSLLSLTCDTLSDRTPFPWIAANPGLKNADGSPHAIPGPHAVTGCTRDVTQAPYLCNPADDASDDRPGIEAALNAAAPGDEIYFPDGTYNLKTAWSTDAKCNIRLKSLVNLRGESEAGVVLKTDFNDAYAAANPAGTNSCYIIRGFEVNNVSVRNLTLTAAWNGTYSTDTTINNPEHGGPDYGLMLNTYSNSVVATYNIYVENVTVEKFINAGLNAGTGCHDVVFKNCIARNATDVGGGGCGYGFQLSGFFPGNGLATNPHLGTPRDHYFNLVDGCRTTGNFIRHGVVIQYWSHNNLVTNCDFTDTRIDAIDLHGEDEYNNEIALNTVANCPGESGIGVGNGGGGGTVLHDKAGPHNFIHHNTIVNCKYGITVQYHTPFTRVENNTVSGFTASGGRGIRLGNAPYTTLKGNIVQNNTGTSYCGFLLFSESAMGVEPAGSPVHCTITDNSVLNNPNAAAFQINAGSQNVFSGNIASGNGINVLP